VSDPELPVSVLPNNRFVVVLLYVPLVEEVTVTVMLHVLLAAIVAFVTVIRFPPEEVIVPPHCGVVTLAASVTPLGKVSVKFAFVIAAEPGLVMVNVSVDVPPGRIVLGENDLVRLAFTI